MKKSILVCIFITLLISGCSPKTVIPPTEDKSKIISIQSDKNLKIAEALYWEKDIVTYNSELNTSELSPRKKSYVKMNTNLRKVLKMAAEEAIKNNKSHFIIVEKNMNQLYDLPLVEFKNINDYCFKGFFYEFKPYGACSSVIGEIGSYFKFEMVDNPDYTIPAINAKEIINEINSYKITVDELSMITEEKNK